MQFKGPAGAVVTIPGSSGLVQFDAAGLYETTCDAEAEGLDARGYEAVRVKEEKPEKPPKFEKPMKD